jgi:hypothetical protein
MHCVIVKLPLHHILNQQLICLCDQQKNVLVTVGDDDQSSSQSSAICLKVFDLDKVQEEGSSTTTPFCVQILRVFTDQFPQAKVNSPSSF